ncbi:rhodanese-like domain-containing protein [Deinococcus sp. QL22]|uniref:rhodanese-like domain-containing protein n=1 Tax=Deinococcus sp. QL22 TaxID=2939437 RepID=UPI002017873D|nr:rhodanese-like domain-containing protein [Deinococcus sp. QL22]UQN06237.1 rhodanese-like domain-containing protein [Deinococcus sp. QL22]
MLIPPNATLIDLRSEALRAAQPLGEYVNNSVLAVTLEAIEEGTHSLATVPGPLLVICERGVRSGLAARYLRADGLDAGHVVGGLAALIEK